jgi:non-heme chloroperoxidase
MSANTSGFSNLEEAADAVAAYLPHRPRPASSKGLQKSLRMSPDGRLRWHWDPAFHSSSGQRSADGMFERMATAAKNIAVPTLLISGKQSEVVSHDGAQKLLELIPHAEWVNVAEASHMVAGDSNEAFFFALEAFLNRIFPDELNPSRGDLSGH